MTIEEVGAKRQVLTMFLDYAHRQDANARVTHSGCKVCRGEMFPLHGVSF